MIEDIYAIPEATRYLKISKSKVLGVVQQGKIPCVRIDRNVKIRETDLKNWIEKDALAQVRSI